MGPGLETGMEAGMEAGKSSRIGAVILAAGMSSRMGEAKQLLRLGENTLLGHAIENVRGSRVSEIVLVLGHEAETIQQRLAIENLKVVINEAYREGMATSLRAGLSALNPGVDAAFIVLADQPFVRPAIFDRLIDEYRKSEYQKSKARIVIPIYKGFRGNPVLLDRSVFAEVMALSGDVGCRTIFANHLERIVNVSVDDVGILLDVDSKDDLEKLKHFDRRTADEGALLDAASLDGRANSGAGEDR
jgi:molybdenum cofactor cytidylyltransferase